MMRRMGSLLVLVFLLALMVFPAGAQDVPAVVTYEGLMDNPLFVPLVVVSLVALMGWGVVVALVLGSKELLKMAFESFPKEQAVQMTDRFYEFAKQSQARWDDPIARGGQYLASRYDDIKHTALGEDVPGEIPTFQRE